MTDNDQLNADLTQPLAIDTATLTWAPSPAPGVHRKRLFRNGPPESGRVTSLVQYAPGSHFPSHPHPEGEEIFVLSGVFTDVRGDWPAGSYLLNPEGFEHSPSSAPGCELFVRLRQAPGDRHTVGLLPSQRQWSALEDARHCSLWSSPDHDDAMRLEHWPQPAERVLRPTRGGEYLLLEGCLEVAGQTYRPYSFFRVPPGDTLAVTAETPLMLLVREGGFALMA